MVTGEECLRYNCRLEVGVKMLLAKGEILGSGVNLCKVTLG